MKQCKECKYYDPLKSGDPPAGWCTFIADGTAPFWMENYRTAIDKLGADVMATDGEECGAFIENH